MPLPSTSLMGQVLKSQLLVAGAPGFAVPSPSTGAPFVPLHRMVDLLLSVAWPAVQTSLLSGFFVGSTGSPSALVAIPSPVPVITSQGVLAAVTPLLPAAPLSAAALAASVGWVGPFAASMPAALSTGVLMGLTMSPLSISPTPGDPIFAALSAGYLDFTYLLPTAASLQAAVTGAWSADPDLGPGARDLVASVWLRALLEPLAGVVLTGAVLNTIPPAIAPVVPATPYPHSLPLLIV